MSEDRKAHWQQIYATRKCTEVSWFQPVPERSLGLIRATGTPPGSAILDVGGGASTLVDHLLEDGFDDVSVLDIAAAAIDQSRGRLGVNADRVNWIEADITAFEPPQSYAVWHDRAVFHFLTETSDQERYLEVLRKSLQPGGHLLLATFGPEGPLRCSGLQIQRYSIERLQDFLGPGFQLRHHDIDEHRTPTGSAQQFLYAWFDLAS